jgi:hypothetical protein
MFTRQGNNQLVLGVLAGVVLGVMMLLARHAFAKRADQSFSQLFKERLILYRKYGKSR